ncbi:MAG: exopolysaccharide biosynthesis polyprenyl glycosylphosphotransferase [Sulfuricaulis sp.]
MASDLLPLFDFACLLLAASLSTLLTTHWLIPSSGLATGLGGDIGQAALVAAVLAPFILYDKRFGPVASRGQMPVLVRSHALRFTLFAGVVLALGGISQALNSFPHDWLVTWFATSLLLTSLTRVLMARYVRRLQHQGVLTEVIAVVGAGPVADRLVQALRQTRPETIELLGIFDDKIIGATPSTIKPHGTLAQLLELGKTRKIDWILLTLPPTAEQRLLSMVQRLKALSVPIGLCPQHVGLTVPYRTIDYVGDNVPVSLLADRPIKRWAAVMKGGEDFLIGGIATLLLLPVLAIIALAIKLDSPGPVIFKQRRHAFNNHEFDIYKFRTMRLNAAAAVENLRQTSRHDDRVTRVGRFLRVSSLDELPQLFNVLKGDMSLVGPRPHAVNMRTEDRLGHEITDIYVHRHRVKPGITGWSQVNGSRGAVDTTDQLHRRVELDLHYIENWSVLLDLKILALTCREVLKRTNAY